MTTAAAQENNLNLAVIEKNTIQILKKLNSIPSSFFMKDIQFSKKAEEEKLILIKSLASRHFFTVQSAIKSLNTILQDSNFSKLDKEDQDFIHELEKVDFLNSSYVSEIKAFTAKEVNAEKSFVMIMKENMYFSLLSSELYSIESKLRTILLKP